MNAEKTGKLIRELRTEKGLTQQELASALHVSQTAVSKWESGKSLPDISLLQPLAGSLDVTISEIVLGEKMLKNAEDEAVVSRKQNTEAALKLIIDESLTRQKKKRKRTLWLAHIAAAFLALICIWRFWPHSFAQIMPENAETMKGLYVSTLIASIDKGDFQLDRYEIDLTREPERWRDVQSILEETKYRQDLRNLMPLILNGISAENTGDKTVTISLAWGNETEKTRLIQFLSDRLISVVSGDGQIKQKFYHPGDQDMLEELVQYVLVNGEKK